MSDSRLEKFIYAICSMDVSDLPVPLSRIEKLWNCLITGETPDFEPLSRNEKYLMAMLDRYDISNLPAPMSRGEKLLYKIAVGETDLSDVPGYLSRYEELLKNLIENGGISGGDFEYVLHTLNQSLYTLYTTAEKPVKRAILKGQTLVNIDSYNDKNDFYNFGADYIDEDGFIQLTARGAWVNAHTHNNSLVKPNTKYAIIVDIKENTLDSSMSNALKICTNTDTLDSVWSDINGIEIAGGVTGRLFFTATTSNKVSGVKMLQRAFIGNALKTGHIKYRWMIIEYQKGMENWDIPYFGGMTSVKMPVLTTVGKNLFNGELENGAIVSSTGANTPSTDNVRSVGYIKVKPNTSIVLSNDLNYSNNIIYEYDSNKNYICRKTTNPFTTSTNCHYIRFRSDANQPNLDVKYQIEYGTQATSYEPHKTNILSTSEDVVLRGIGEVKDELNLLTGEVVQSVGVLNGEETGWQQELHTQAPTDSSLIAFSIDSIKSPNKNLLSSVLVNSGEVNKPYRWYVAFDTWLIITLPKSEVTNLDEFKAWLKNNEVLYPLAEKSIKTIDLTVVDQDDQPTKLGTFENITHVSLEAENLIPEVELEVATRISTELASASPLMDDISTEQQQLETTVDEQSENVDATMIATTEIFEEIL